MAYKTQIGAMRYNNRMNKIWETYYQQQREKNIIAKDVFKIDYDKLSDDKKRKIDYIWGEKQGV
jgi:hypothetical protein